MSELEPTKHPHSPVSPAHIPQEIVPVPIEDARQFVRDAVHGTNLTNPVLSLQLAWAFFEPRLRYTAVDAGHTRIELDLVEVVPGATALLYPQRRAEVDRFFVSLQDELVRRERWQPSP